MTAALVFAAALAGFCVRFGAVRTLVRVNRKLAAKLSAEQLASGTKDLALTGDLAREHLARKAMENGDTQ